jgi:hypothetical protein
VSRFIIINFPVFSDYCVHVEITSNLHKSISKYPACQSDGDFCEEHSDALTIGTQEMSFIFLKRHVDAGTIAHEACHAVRNLLDTMGVGPDSETHAYHVGYVVNKITKFKGRRT